MPAITRRVRLEAGTGSECTVQRRFVIATAMLAAIGLVSQALPGLRLHAQTSDLEGFMKQVLTRRDDNWQKLQQYTLEPEETFQLSALNGRKLFGFKREYTWFPREDGVFIRSPLTADGVTISEDDRRKAEADWLREQEQRAKNRAERERKRAEREGREGAAADPQDANEAAAAGPIAADQTTVENVRQAIEPGFVDNAYFMKFKFDAGTYAFAGREKLLGRDVLKIEYYPKRFFTDPPRKPNDDPKKQASQAREDRFEAKMDKVSMITLWIEPTEHQILQYEFTNIDFDFLPGRQLMRFDEMRASMRMREAFPNVWLPDTVAMAFGLTSALGDVAARYDVKYHDYKLAEVKARVR